jgi:pimeloyl-[acyl-carrier protein] methyl ester esterase
MNIILITGWSQNPNSLKSLADWLSGHFKQDSPNITLLSPGVLCQRHLENKEEGTCDYAKMLRGVITEKGIKKPIVMGWSLGGMIAVEYAEKFLNEISLLVLFGTTTKFVTSEDYATGAPKEMVQAMAKALEVSPEEMLGKFFENVYFPIQVSKEVIAEEVSSALAESLPVLLDGLDYLVRADLRDGLVKIKEPALILHCQQDRITPFGAAQYLAEHLSNSQLVKLANSGHKDLVSDENVFKKIAEFISTKSISTNKVSCDG